MAYQNRNNRSNYNDVEVEVGQQFKMTIKRMGINGEGIGFYEHKLVLLPVLLPMKKSSLK